MRKRAGVLWRTGEYGYNMGTSPRTLLDAWQIKAKKQLGQNFLRYPAIAEKIVGAARLLSEDTILEIGAGLGSLTIPAARKARWVYAVETDGRITGLLKAEILAAGLENVRILKKDILRLDISDLAAGAGGRFVIMGNLPYHISSQVLIRLIESRRLIHHATLMFQKELADRLLAPPGTKAYGRLTVMLAYCADIRRLMNISADSFFPRPKVDSTVLGIQFKSTLDVAPEDEIFFHHVIKAAFSKRRKTLKNALSGSHLELSPRAAIAALTAAGIDPVRRAETLTVEEFVQLSNHLAPACREMIAGMEKRNPRFKGR